MGLVKPGALDTQRKPPISLQGISTSLAQAGRRAQHSLLPAEPWELIITGFKEIEVCLGGASLTGCCSSEIAKVSVSLSLGVARRLPPPPHLAVSRGTLDLAHQPWTLLMSALSVLPEENVPCSWQ